MSLDRAEQFDVDRWFDMHPRTEVAVVILLAPVVVVWGAIRGGTEAYQDWLVGWRRALVRLRDRS